MPVVKKCPSCGHENDIQSSLCDYCYADISGIKPVDSDLEPPEENEGTKDNKNNDNASETLIESRRLLHFNASDNSGGFSIEDGSIIGREAEGREYLASHMTVSRRHAKIIYNGSWLIEDLNSSNGTWVNERKLGNGEQMKIKSGDRVALSRSCVFNIVTE